MDITENISLGIVSLSAVKAFNHFLRSCDGDLLKTINFLVQRVHPSLYQFSKQDKVELYVDVYKYQIKESLKALDDFVTQMKLSSHSDAIEILALHCGIIWKNDDTLQLTANHRNIIFAALNKDRIENKHCDLKVLIGDKECYNVHRCILAGASPYFAHLLQAGRKVIKITNTHDSKLLSDVLNFIYTESITINKENCQLLLRITKRLEIKSLEDMCQTYIDLLQVSNGSENKNNEEISNDEIDTHLLKDEECKVDLLVVDDMKGKLGNESDSNEEIDKTDSTPLFDFEAEILDRNLIEESTSEYSHPCIMCDDTLPEEHSFNVHLLLHDTNSLFSCDLCNESFSEQSIMQNHIEEVHKNESSDQETAITERKERNELDSNSALAVSTVVCYQTKTDNHKNSYKSWRNKRRNKEFQCEICNSLFRTKSHLKRHMISHTGERKHCCTTCGKLFLKADHLTRHERSHSAERPYQCHTCEKKFKTKDNLKRHHLTHTNERPFFCELCAKQFKDFAGLQIHQRSHNNSERVCPQCGKCFKQQNRLKSHIARHNNPLICTICGRKFSFKNHLHKHMLHHAGVRPFNCETCGRQFSNAHGLKLHQKKHTGIGLHPCELCGSKFLDKFHLDRHLKTHTGEKPFTCDICNRSFSRADNCENHRRSCQIKFRLQKNLDLFSKDSFLSHDMSSLREKLGNEKRANSRKYISSEIIGEPLLTSNAEITSEADELPEYDLKSGHRIKSKRLKAVPHLVDGDATDNLLSSAQLTETSDA